MSRQEILMALARARSEIVDVIVDQGPGIDGGRSVVSRDLFQRLEGISQEISDVGDQIYGEDRD
jgi:hypothetical protein